MEKLTKALMTDETGQAIVAKLTALSGQMHELAMATRGSAILFESESDISVLGDGGYLAVYVGSTNPLVVSGWTGDNSLVTGHLYYLVKSGTAVASSDLGTYGGAVTDTTLSISGSPADAKAVGDALSDITIEVDDTLSEQGKAADAKAVGNAIAGITIEVDDTLSEQGKAADAKAVGDAVDAVSDRVTNLESGSAYIEPVATTVKLVPTVTLPNTRINGGTASEKQGENSYLFSFADMEALGISALVSKFTSGISYFGVYTYNQSTDTYTYTNGVITNYAPTIRNGYDGFFYTMKDSFDLDDLVFYTAIPVVTKDGYKHATQRGFRSIAHGALPLIAAPATGYMRFGGLEENTVYILDTNNLAIGSKLQMWRQLAKGITNAYYTDINATQHMYANIGKAPTYLETRPGQQVANLRTLIQRGIYVWELNDIEDLIQARTNISKQILVHAGNFMDQMLFALAQGWSGCEVDVRTTSDGVNVFSHDATYRNVTIASSTYADLVDAAPDIVTMDEMLQLLAKFKGDIMLHWQDVTDGTVRLRHIQKAYGYGVRFVEYSFVSGGNIGDISVQDFWKTGVAYCAGLPESYRDLTHPNARYDIGSHLQWNPADLGSGVTLTHTNLTDGTYDEYNSLLAYIHLPCLYQ